MPPRASYNCLEDSWMGDEIGKGDFPKEVASLGHQIQVHDQLPLGCEYPFLYHEECDPQNQRSTGSWL
ncbi:hypothetical protein SLA2020_409530 [Shorea laevis]